MKPTTESEYKRRITKVLVHIQENLREPLALGDLARVASFSPYHFHRVFRGMTGESVKEHIRRLRLEAAAQRLKHGDATVTEIAFETGYEAHESFTRAFQSRFGCAPSEFRKRAREKTAVTSGGDPATDAAFAPLGEARNAKGRSEPRPPLEVEIVSLSPQTVGFVRHVGPYPEVGATWQKLMTFAMMKGLFGTGTQMIGLCHDDPEVTDPEKLRYDACISITSSIQPEGDFGVQEIAGGPYAKALHVGPYEQLGDAWARLAGEWLPSKRYEPDAKPGFEVYRNSPMNAAPEALETVLHLPLRPLRPTLARG